MKRFVWSTKYNIGIPEIDEQHTKLVAILVDLNDKSKSCPEDFILNPYFDELEKYTSYHFSREEELMRLNNYPFLSSHMRDHEFFRNKIAEWRTAKMECKALTLTVFLTEWLLEHILHTDIKIKEFLEAQKN